MLAYLDGTPVTITIPLVDGDGNPLVPIEVRYRVADQDDVEKVAVTVIEDYTDSAVITIAGELNTLAAGEVRALRVVEVFVTVEGGTIRLEDGYYIEASEVLIEGQNSFQTYRKACFVSYELPGILGWNDAPKAQRIAAMIAARRNICKLQFRYVYDGFQNIIDNVVGIKNLAEATVAEWQAMPKDFREAVCRAQVLEANYILGGDEIGDLRRAGIASLTVGEAKQFFRSTTALEGVVCKQAMKELARYVLTRTRIGRG